MPEAASLNGEYLVPWARVGPVQEDSRNSEVGEQLWKWLEDQVKDVDNEISSQNTYDISHDPVSC